MNVFMKILVILVFKDCKSLGFFGGGGGEGEEKVNYKWTFF